MFSDGRAPAMATGSNDATAFDCRSIRGDEAVEATAFCGGVSRMPAPATPPRDSLAHKVCVSVVIVMVLRALAISRVSKKSARSGS